MASRFLVRSRTSIASLGMLLCITVGANCLPVLARAGSDNCPASAAASHGWGAPSRSDNFDSPASLSGWHLYDGPGHAGNGRRTPDAVSVSDGVLTITGDAGGNSEGMTWSPGQMYGRWEVCAKSPRSSPNYHSVLLLWPDAASQTRSGEVDFMEIADPTRQTVEAFLHYGGPDQKEAADVAVDATQWHSWALEWTPSRIATFVDGVQRWETADPAHLPTGPMKLCMQLDDFGGDISAGGQLMVDWARQYPLAGRS